jgi:hypothetical protein
MGEAPCGSRQLIFVSAMVEVMMCRCDGRAACRYLFAVSAPETN